MLGRLGYLLFWFGLVMFASWMIVDGINPPVDMLFKSHELFVAFAAVVMGIGAALYMRYE